MHRSELGLVSHGATESHGDAQSEFGSPAAPGVARPRCACKNKRRFIGRPACSCKRTWVSPAAVGGRQTRSDHLSVLLRVSV